MSNTPSNVTPASNRALLAAAVEQIRTDHPDEGDMIVVVGAVLVTEYNVIHPDGSTSVFLAMRNTDHEGENLAAWETLGYLEYAIQAEVRSLRGEDGGEI